MALFSINRLFLEFNAQLSMDLKIEKPYYYIPSAETINLKAKSFSCHSTSTSDEIFFSFLPIFLFSFLHSFLLYFLPPSFHLSFFLSTEDRLQKPCGSQRTFHSSRKITLVTSRGSSNIIVPHVRQDLKADPKDLRSRVFLY